ncbi:type II toxin-antitoxin system VapC family toxin [bacterium]|nr:type II toxin-antitoxin system VapC family toxin [bacterium]
MSVCYLDTSVLVAVSMQETGYATLIKRLLRYKHIVSHHLIESELIATFSRESIDPVLARKNLELINLVFPAHSLLNEIIEVQSHGYIRGADALHLATAVWIAGEDRKDLTFLTLDKLQASSAKALGFK